jgi:hypothetical protein
MSTTIHIPGDPWVRTHRAVLAIALLAAALAATLALLLLQLTTGSTAITPASGSVSTGQQSTGVGSTGGVPVPAQQQIDERCQVRRVGLPHC